MADTNINTGNPPVNTPPNTVNTPPNTGGAPINTRSIPPKELEEETVAVPKAFLEKMVSDMDELRNNQKQYEQTASQDQIKKIEALRASGKLVKSVKIPIYDGRHVKSWQPTHDEVYIDHGIGKEVSRQMTKLSFYDGKDLEVSQIDFARRKKFEEMEVVGETKTKDGEIQLTTIAKDGREFIISSKFVN